MKGLYLIILLVLFLPANSQNLVSNAGFDTSSTNPTSYAQICYPTGWNSPSGYCAVAVGHGSPDYYKSGGIGGAGTPVTFWATVSPHNGAGMAGFATYYPSYLNFREYVSTTLSSPLIPGTTYEVSFWLTNGITWLNGKATNNIGVSFTTSPLTQPAAGYIAATPQVEYTDVLWDTLWHQLSFIFTATDASEYMTIGNFRTDAATTIETKKVVPYPTSSAAYYYIDDVVVQPYLALPLTLLSFNGNATPAGNLLNWTTTKEIHTSHFEIQRSADGIFFETIGTVNAKGAEAENVDYTFLDDQPLSQQNLYLLKMVDEDGSFQFSEIVNITTLVNDQFEVYPNPVNGILTINGDWDANATFQIIDMAGNIIYTKHTTSATKSVLQVDFSNYAPGIYIVQLISTHGIFSSPIIKTE